MMENLEICAKTVEEATKKALARLNVGLEEVEITVLNEGRSGILGIGSEDARISIRLMEMPLSDDAKLAKSAEEILHNILDKMGIQANIDIQEHSFSVAEDGDSDPVTLNITGNDLGILIGRKGQTLEALQYLVRLISSKKAKFKSPLIIDVENYKKRRYEDLRTLALNVAEQVKAKRSSLKLEPMSPFERRIIHLALADDPEIATESTGEGESRKVVVLLKNKK
jgi:spoIIIJ-associated protein